MSARFSGLLTLIALMALPVQAQLAPFSATYSATLDLLIELPVAATRRLERDANGSWQFISEAKSAFASQLETSRLTYSQGTYSQGSDSQGTYSQGTHPQGTWAPTNYRFVRSVFGRKREISIDLDASAKKITTIAEQRPWTQPYEPGVQDKLSYQLQLREDLIAGREELSYRIADGGRIKTYRFVRIGKETLTTAAGTFDCLRLQLERAEDQQQTLIWMAPALDYLTIRLLRIDASGREHFLNLKSIEAN